jgi:DNA-binding NarL/FixJ family response regulator
LIVAAAIFKSLLGSKYSQRQIGRREPVAHLSGQGFSLPIIQLQTLAQWQKLIIDESGAEAIRPAEHAGSTPGEQLGLDFLPPGPHVRCSRSLKIVPLPIFMAKRIKVMIAEDHDVVREGLKILIGSDPGLQVAGEANNGHSAARLARKLQPDVIVMDLAMPRGSGLEAARHIQRESPNSKVLVLSAYQDEDTVQQVLKAGVAGYLTKHSAADELLTAIRQVGQGKAYFSPKIASQLRDRQRFTSPRKPRDGTSGNLTRREQEVLVLIAKGQPNKEIAYNLSLSIKTVEKHRQAAMDKLNIHDIAGLTRYVISKEVIAPPAQARTTAAPL